MIKGVSILQNAHVQKHSGAPLFPKNRLGISKNGSARVH
jgi:hypothetical protein